MEARTRALTPESLGAWLLKTSPGSAPERFADVTSRCVRRSYRTDLIAPGQPVLLWFSGRDPQRPAGIYAEGRTTGRAVTDDEGQLVMPIALQPLALPVLRTELLAHPVLSRLEVLRMPAGSNPSYLSRTELSILRQGPMGAASPSPAGRGRNSPRSVGRWQGMTATPISILDLAQVAAGGTAADSFRASVEIARLAERSGYRRVWYAEHHNMATIASSATSVLIAHVAAHTSSIRLGAGGVMLPNHSPLVIAEQFGTLETLHPGRIDLGLGRAPGSDQNTMRALRRNPASSDSFPGDVQELQGYLSGRSRIPGVDAIPGKGTNVPLYILGSSLFGAQLAAALGLPYAFASHFAPQALTEAVATYRRNFQPSEQLAEPWVIAGANVVVADSSEEAHALLRESLRLRVTQLVGRGRSFTDAEADAVLDSPSGQQIRQMSHYTAVGDPDEVRAYLDKFVVHADADEVIVASMARSTEATLRSFELLSQVADLEG